MLQTHVRDQYPEWLWALADPKKPLSEMTPDDPGYWRTLRKARNKDNNLARRDAKL